MPRIVIPDTHIPPHDVIFDAVEGAGFAALKANLLSPSEGDSPDNSGIEEFVNFVDSHSAEFGLAASDTHLAMLYDCESRCSSDFTVCAPSHRQYSILVNKLDARDLFEKWDVPIAKGRLYRSIDDVAEIASKHPTPCICKFSSLSGSTGVVAVASHDELQRVLIWAKLLDQGIVVEEFLGPTEEVSHQFFSAEGRWYPAYTLRKHAHLAPSFSTAVEVLGASEEEALVEPFQSFFASLDRGYYSAQLKRDTNGKLRLIEINCRLGNNYRIVQRLLPEFSATFLSFYCEKQAWYERYQRHRKTIRKRYGVSAIELLIGEWRQVRADPSRGTIGKEIMFLLKILMSRPVVDYYFASLFSNPVKSIRYYRYLNRKIRSEGARWKTQKSFVSR